MKDQVAFYNFTNSNKLEDCIFELQKTLSGLHYLDAIFGPKHLTYNKINHYTYNEVMELGGFFIKNKNKAGGSKYKTAKAFINRIEKELVNLKK